MKSSLNYQTLLSKIARNQYKLHGVKQEWKMFILLVLFIKVLTWFISVYAGINWFVQIWQSAIENKIVAVSFALAILIGVEWFTNLSLAKFFKFLFRGVSQLSSTLALALLVAFLFSVSFYTSTNGLAMRQSKKVDNSGIIMQRYSLKESNIKNDYSERKADLSAQITSLRNNPQGWKNGKRSVLMAWQLNKVDSLLVEKAALKQAQKNEIMAIGAQKQSDLEINKEQTTAEADKYYNIVMVIMFVQFISSGMLMFFWKIIWKQDDEPGVISEFTKELKDTVEANIYQVFKNYMATANNAITLELQKESAKQPFVIPIDQNGAQDNENTKQIIGFGNQAQKLDKKTDLKTDLKTVTKPSERPERPNHLSDFKTANIHRKNIEFLNKHRILVKSIKKLRIEEFPLTNVNVKRVQQIALRTQQKSPTTIRKVYNVVIAIGLDKIDENGNITF